MKNIHPRVVELLNRQLLNGGVVKSAISVNDDTSAIVVQIGPSTQMFNLPKSDILQRYPSRETTITVSRGSTVMQAFAALAERDNLFLISGVDYKADKTVIEFDDNGNAELTLTILSNSIMYTGNVKVYVVCSDKAIVTNKDPYTLPLNYERVALALVSQIYSLTGTPVFTGNQLTRAFCVKVIDKLTSLSLPLYEDAVDQMQQGEVLSVHNDGISDIMTMRDLSGVTYLIRFKPTDETDAPIL